ncbi:MAG: hypothetical protein R3C04_08910 [Hyphomonas sp.]
MRITCRTPDYAKILDSEEAEAREATRAWTKTRKRKEELFGAEAHKRKSPTLPQLTHARVHQAW